MIILINPKMNIIDYQFNLTSWASLTSSFKSICFKLYLCSAVPKTRLSSIAIIYIERSYANSILQESMDRIIDFFGKRKNRQSFKQSVHVLIILLYIGLSRLVQ